MQIAGNVHIVDCHQTSLTDGKFASNDFAYLPLEEFAHTLESKRRHRDVK